MAVETRHVDPELQQTMDEAKERILHVLYGLKGMHRLSDERRYQDGRGLSRASNRQRAYTLTMFCVWLGTTPLLEAGAGEIQAWLEERCPDLRTRSWHLSNLACFYKWAVIEELIDKDPSIRVPRPRVRRLLPRPIATGDLELALAAADQRMRCWLLLAAYQGLRAGEIARLRREDVMEAHNPPLLIVERGKGGKQRIVPLNPLVFRALVAFGLPTRGYMWPGKLGSLHPKTVSRYVNVYLRELGIQATTHQGRHWFATEIYRRSQDLRLTQELMGHANPGTTAIYTAWSPARAAEVVRDLSVS